MKPIIASIDIGTDTTKFIVGEYYNNKINVLASHTIKSKGIRKGLIVDPNLATNMIKDGMKVINGKLGITIKKVLVNIPSYNVNFMLVTGSLEIKNEDGLITTDDVNRVIKNSVYGKIPDEYELLTVVPIDFIIDGNKGNSKPVGKNGQKLEIKGIMISVPKKSVYSVLNVMEEAGLDVVDIILSGMADYFEVKSDNIKNKVGAIINLGHDTTTVSVVNHGKLMNTEVLQMGGINIEKDIAYVFGVSVFDARTLKEKFASSHKRFCQLNDVYEVKNTLGDFVKLNQLEVSEVVMSRLSEILELSRKQILLLTKHEINYLVITGGLTEIKSFKNLVYEIFDKNVIIYSVNTLGARDNKYVTALGMIKYFIDKMETRGRTYSMLNDTETLELTSPREKEKKDNTISKFFTNFIGNKEEK